MNVRRKVAAGVAVVGGLLVLPAVASAHTTNVSAACGEGLHVDVALYPEGVTTTVIIDGDVVDVIDRGVNNTYDLGDPTVPHSYEVIVDGAEGDEFDRSFSDTVEACVEPETTEPPAAEPPATEPPATEPPATEPPATTETTVAPLAAPPVEAPPAASPAAPQAASSQAQELPATGSTSTGLVIAAAATLVAGVTMWLVSRRRRVA